MFFVGVALIIVSVIIETITIQGLSLPTTNASLSVSPGSFTYVRFVSDTTKPVIITYISTAQVDFYFANSAAFGTLASVNESSLAAAAVNAEKQGVLQIMLNGTKGVFPYTADYAAAGAPKPNYYSNNTVVNGTYYAIFANSGKNAAQVTYYKTYMPSDYAASAVSLVGTAGLVASLIFFAGIIIVVFSFFRPGRNGKDSAEREEKKVDELYAQIDGRRAKPVRTKKRQRRKAGRK